jgi:disulfide bond formation protein DsbB
VGVDTVTLFLALLAVVAFVVAVGLLISFATGDRLGLWAALRPLSTESAAAVAVTATAGSLYLSEVAHYTPCRLCWIQRGFMYPAAVLLVVSAVTGRAWARHLAGILAVVGLPVSLFHRYEQAFGGVGDFCEQDNPCSLRWVNEFGFMTIPTMAGIGFFAIAVLVGLRFLDDRRVTEADHDDELVSNRS